MADSLLTQGVVRSIADDSGDKVDGFQKIAIAGGTAVWTKNAQSPGSPAVLTLTPAAGLAISGTDNRIVRMDGTGALQDSGWVITDTDDLAIVDGTQTIALYPGSIPFMDIDDTAVDQRFRFYRDGRIGFLQLSTSEGVYLEWPDPSLSGSGLSIVFPQLAGTVVLNTTPFAAAARIHGSGSGGTSSIELVAERLLSIDADGVGLASATEGQIIDFGGGLGAARVTDSPKIGGDQRVYCDPFAGVNNRFVYVDPGLPTGLVVSATAAPVPNTADGAMGSITLYIASAVSAGEVELWIPVVVESAHHGRTIRITGAGANIIKDFGDDCSLVSIGVHSANPDADAAVADWDQIGVDTTGWLGAAAPDGPTTIAATWTAAAAAAGLQWVRLVFDVHANDVGREVGFTVYLDSLYVTYDTL